MRWLSLAAVALCACRAGPELDGESLRCDGTCPRDLRCVEGVCVNNSPPEVESFGDPLRVEQNQEVTRAAAATDADGDPLTFSWQQISGPTVSLNADGANVTLQPSELGIVVLRVSVDDGFVATPVTADLTIVVQPVGAAGAVYVAASGATSDCGTYDVPCATVHDAVREHPAADFILVAANGSAAYRECLELDGTVEVRGGHDPVTWEFRDELRALTRVECFRCTAASCHGCDSDATLCAHELGGTARVRDVTVQGAPEGAVAVAATVVLNDGAPSLEDVDVQMPVCDGCSGVGVAVLDADATLGGVNVASAAAGSGATEAIGMLLAGGTVSVSGDLLDPTSPAPDVRGHVQVSAPGTLYAAPVVAVGGSAILSHVMLEGRFAAGMNGLNARSSTVRLESSRIELLGAGTQSMAAVSVIDCAADTTCLCPFEVCSSLPMPTSGVSSARIIDSVASLTSEAEVFGLAPCSGGGVVIESNDVTVSGSTIHIGEGFSRGIGVALLGPNEVGNPNVISVNQIDIADAVVSPLCDLLLEPITVLDLLSASFGIWSDSGLGAQVTDNVVVMGSNDMTSVGLVHTGGDSFVYAGNTFQVGYSSDLVRADLAAGAVLSATGAESVFDGNRLLVGGATDLGYGLALLSTAPWRVENNLIYAGDGAAGIGLVMAPLVEGLTCPADVPWPQIVHNTIHGGGGRSAAVTIGYQATPCFGLTGAGPHYGILVNNLFDAGAGTGRRVGIEELWPFILQPDRPFGAAGNLVQVPAPSTRIGLMAVLPERGGNTAPWTLLLDEAAVVGGINVATPTEYVYALLPDRPVATWGNGALSSSWPELVAGPGYVSVFEAGTLTNIPATLATGLGEVRPLDVTGVAMVESDIAVLAELDGVTGLWRMLARGDGSYAAPRQLAAGAVLDGDALIDGTASGLVVVASQGRVVAGRLGVGDFTIEAELDAAGGSDIEALAVLSEASGHEDAFWLAGGNLMHARVNNAGWSAADTTPVCAAGAPVGLAAGFDTPLAFLARVVIACDDGTVEPCSYSRLGDYTPAWATPFDTGLGAELSGIAVRGTRILALARANHEVRQFQYNGAVPEWEAEPAGANSAVLSGDVAHLRVILAAASLPGVSGGFTVASTACTFAGTDPVDLHLTTAGDCATLGASGPLTFGSETVVLPAQDIDGDARAGSPHVGADEP